MTEQGLALIDGDRTFVGDYEKMLPRLKQSDLERELLVKAVRIKKADHTIHVLDATAGMGEDSLLLAAAGFEVDLYESNPVIVQLLRDTLDRAESLPELAPFVARMHFHEEDSIQAMGKLSETPDVIYLDPMFPEKTKHSLTGKRFQLIHQLEQPCQNEEELLQAAIDSGARKIVIKRPLKGSYLAGRKPSHSYEGKAIRYDCIVLL